MKEIKAYVRKDSLNRSVEALDKAGAPGITIVDIHPVGYGYDPNFFEPDFKDVLKRYQHVAVVKLEVVCADHDADRLVEVLRRCCCTGAKGDGWIFVSSVARAVRIRDGAGGEEAL